MASNKKGGRSRLLLSPGLHHASYTTSGKRQRAHERERFLNGVEVEQIFRRSAEFFAFC